MAYNSKYTGAEIEAKLDLISGITAALFQEITYSALVALRDNGELDKGMSYRITDFVTTTGQTDTQSAGHQFDVIVVADSESTLNENARAALHEGDTYFADCNLAAWELKYCLDNDHDRFNWAKYIHAKQLIVKYGYNTLGATYKYTSSLEDGTVIYVWELDQVATMYNNTDAVYTTTLTPTAGTDTVVYCKMDGDGITDIQSYNITIQSVIDESTEEGFGVIYYMRDQNDNQLNYDFKNIQFLDSSEYFYTFDNSGEDRSNDSTTINNIIVNKSGALYKNIFKGSTYHNLITGEFYDNIIGGNCFDNYISAIFFDNTLDAFVRNIVAGYFSYNTFNNNLTDNTFSGYNSSITATGGCSYNEFSGRNSSLTFASLNYSTINNLQLSNSDASISNSKLTGTSNTFHGSLQYVVLTGKTTSITLDGTILDLIIENSQNVTIQDNYLRSVSIRNCSYVTLTCSISYSSVRKQLGKLELKGLTGTSSNPIEVDPAVRGNDYLIEFKSESTQVILV